MVSTIEVRDADESDRDVLMSFHRSLYQGHRDKVVAKQDLPLLEYRDYDRILRVAAATAAGKARLYASAVIQALQVLRNERPDHLVNPEVWPVHRQDASSKEHQS